MVRGKDCLTAGVCVCPIPGFRFPPTAVREVEILKKLTHENMVTLKEFATSRGAQRTFDRDDDEEDAAKRKHVRLI